MLLVHSLTLRDDNQPIESRGVDPDVAISNPDWRAELVKYFRSSSLIEALRSEASKPPIKN
jgi:C-terminal processing protease CtpA/Prc